ncbi:MAG: helix-turn-helix transcriptional regulator [Ruminococcaceae bacterium]|nr:helix-turn-helix transcriptional regulator [Oscillospiraceae bacterium]
MSLIDISKNRLYISKIVDVISSENRNKNKKTHVSGRHSDALIYVLDGSCAYEIEGGKHFCVDAGEVLYLAHGSKYCMTVTSDSYKVIYCDFEFHSNEPRESNRFSPQNKEHVKNLFFKLKNTFSQRSSASFGEAMSVLYSIYAAVLALSDTSYVTSGTKSKMAPALRFLNAHLGDATLTVAQLAKMSDMSEVYFRSLFKSTFGSTPSQYITSARLKRACELMNYPFLSLEECAIQSGFSSLQYFCRVFKAQTGTTPSKFRKTE